MLYWEGHRKRVISRDYLGLYRVKIYMPPLDRTILCCKNQQLVLTRPLRMESSIFFPQTEVLCNLSSYYSRPEVAEAAPLQH